ncbi:MAG: hypothetical protein KDJ67_01950 [Nitratireductor sp.]|nr:hypothetical protein [Nitratireductor sp.]
MNTREICIFVGMAAMLAGCQTSTSTASKTGMETSDLSVAEGQAVATDPNAAPVVTASASDPGLSKASLAAESQSAASPTASAAQTPQVAQQCTIALAGGPPPKPARGADFGKAVVKDVGKNVSRNLLTLVGGAVGGQIGSAVASGTAQATIRSEGDIKGTWMITDGSPGCACQVDIGGLFKLQGKGSDTGTLKPSGCNNPALQQMASWALGYSFSGYDAKFELKARDKKTVLATLNREGIHYFAGTMADGTPVTLWRDGQNYNAFKK